VLASCANKYYGTNFISAVPTSLLIAPGLRTIQFLLLFNPLVGASSRKEPNLTTFRWVVIEN
jgi:hypothetical protein